MGDLVEGEVLRVLRLDDGDSVLEEERPVVDGARSLHQMFYVLPTRADAYTFRCHIAVRSPGRWAQGVASIVHTR